MEQIEKAATVLLGSRLSAGHSKSFQVLIRLIGEAKTKHEEDRIIKKEATFLKKQMGAPDTTPRQMREYLVRLIYCEMLGVECPWGYIHAVKLTQSSNLLDKRTGYLAASLLLHSDHELIMLLINTLQKDLRSSNILEVSMALIIICKLIGKEMIPPLITLVQDKLFHPKELVRKKAILAIHHFYTIAPDTVSHLQNEMRRALADTDPGAMEAALLLYQDLTADDPASYQDLVESFISILGQILQRKLPSEFEYHSVPAPWMQMRLLRILGYLGADNYKSSEQIYPIVQEALASAECNSNIGQAIAYECIQTITKIYPNTAMIEKAATAVFRFLSSSNNNWKYIGITALTLLVQVNPKYAAEHQMVVIDCLDDPDETLKRKTLDLLFKMTNPKNVCAITEKLLTYLKGSGDEYIRKDLVSKITQLAERFAPDNQWFIQTMNSVFELGGALVRTDVAHNLMRLIAEGTEDEEKDSELRVDAVSSYVELLEKPVLPDILVKIICWVVGEYAYVLPSDQLEGILEAVAALLNRKTLLDHHTKCWVVSAVCKLVAQLGSVPDSIHSQMALTLTSPDTDLQQRSSEMMELTQNMNTMQDVLPLDSSCEDLEVDSSLSFLDDYVAQAMASGSSPYKSRSQRTQEIRFSPTHQQSKSPAPIKFEPYRAPSPPSNRFMHHQATPLQPSSTNQVKDDSPNLRVPHSSGAYTVRVKSDTSSKTKLEVKSRLWSRSGYQSRSTAAALDSPTPTLEVLEHQHSLEHSGSEGGGGGESGEVDHETGEGANPGTPRRQRDSLTAPSRVEASVEQTSPELARKKELASALFGGLTGPAKAPRARSKGPRHSHEGMKGDNFVGGAATGGKGAEKQQQQQQQKQPEINLLLDLEGLDFSASPAVALPMTGSLKTNTNTGGATAAISSSFADDILSLSVPSTSSNAAPLIASSGASNPLQLGGGGGGGGGGGLLANMSIHQPSRHPPPSSSSSVSSSSPSSQTAPNSSQAPTLPPSTSSSLQRSPISAHHSGTDGLNDMLGLLDMPVSVTMTTPAEPVLAPQRVNDFSLLDTGIGPQIAEPKLTEPPKSQALALFETPISSVRIPTEYSQYPLAPDWDNKDLCSDANMRVTATKILKPDQLVFVLTLTNQKLGELRDVSVTLAPPSNLKVCDEKGETLSFNTSLKGFENFSHVLALVPKSPAVAMSMKGQVSYRDSLSSVRKLFFDVSVQVVDLIRPLDITTQVFAQKWSSLRYEKKEKLHSVSVTTATFMSKLKERLNFRPIQTIGSECIAAGVFLPQVPCLVHGRLDPAGTGTFLEVWSRTPSGLLTESLLKAIANTFK